MTGNDRYNAEMAFVEISKLRTSEPIPKDDPQETFKQLKSICVPLLGDSQLTPQSIPRVLSYLSDLIKTLTQLEVAKTEMRPSLLSYVFFPLSTLLGRNTPASIPDQVLEKVFISLSILFESWWWSCDLRIWEQVFMLAGAIVGGVDGKGKGKERDEETKESAARLLLALLRDRSTDIEMTSGVEPSVERSRARLAQYQAHSQTAKFIPVIGQTLTSLLSAAASAHMPLQLISIQLVEVIVATYLPDGIIPSILPGVVSAMTKTVLGHSSKEAKSKRWANGAIVARASKVLEVIIVRAVGDDVCKAERLVRELNDLEDLAELVSDSEAGDTSQLSSGQPYETARTTTWLRGTTAQLFIALNTLTPLVSHPSSVALLSLISMARRLLSEARLTLPQARPLLLSILLSLSRSSIPSVSRCARDTLIDLLTPPNNARHDLLETLLEKTSENLAALPRLLPSRADAKIEHLAGQIEAVCLLGLASSDQDGTAHVSIGSIRSGVGQLLGPTGHIEKWGWSLLGVVEFETPAFSVTRVSQAQLMLENDVDFIDHVVFPEAKLKYVSTQTTHVALEGMLRILGQTGGDDCLYSVDWFLGIGLRGQSARATAALWCASRILEGIAGISLDGCSSGDYLQGKEKRLEQFARSLTKSVADFWNTDEDENEDEDDQSSNNNLSQLDGGDNQLPTEFVQGLKPLQVYINAGSHHISSKNDAMSTAKQPILHKAFLLQLICIASRILQSRFNPLLIHALYPLLHSLISPASHLSSTALSALHYVKNCTAYATPANLLLSNFDYALDSVSRRLTRRWLDVDAAKVLVVLVRLVGRDVVQRASDVVEECFDRLDDFHGYDVIVEGLIEALLEVVKVVGLEERLDEDHKRGSPVGECAKLPDRQRIDLLLEWLDHHNDAPIDEEKEDFGPSPRVAFGQEKGKEPTEKGGEENQFQADRLADPPLTSTEALTKQIVSRSLFFLTHASSLIRAHILTLLSFSAAVLPESALLPSIHRAWPFVLNRLSDSETFVVSAAASLVEALAKHVGSFMTTRIWDDIWPRFRQMLIKLDEADAQSALARHGRGAVGTESAYTHSHRLYRSMLRTMTASVKGVPIQDSKSWDVMMACRRFLHRGAHDELQSCARELYVALGRHNEDALWLLLTSTVAPREEGAYLEHLKQSKWDITDNVNTIFTALATSS